MRACMGNALMVSLMIEHGTDVNAKDLEVSVCVMHPKA